MKHLISNHSQKRIYETDLKMSVLPLVGAKNRSKWLYVPLQRRRKGRKSPSVLRIPHKMTQSTLILQEVTLNLLPTEIFF